MSQVIPTSHVDMRVGPHRSMMDHDANILVTFWYISIRQKVGESQFLLIIRLCVGHRFNVNVLRAFHRPSCDLDRIYVLSVHFPLTTFLVCKSAVGILSEMWLHYKWKSIIHSNLTKNDGKGPLDLSPLPGIGNR